MFGYAKSDCTDDEVNGKYTGRISITELCTCA